MRRMMRFVRCAGRVERCLCCGSWKALRTFAWCSATRWPRLFSASPQTAPPWRSNRCASLGDVKLRFEFVISLFGVQAVSLQQQLGASQQLLNESFICTATQTMTLHPRLEAQGLAYCPTYLLHTIPGSLCSPPCSNGAVFLVTG